MANGRVLTTLAGNLAIEILDGGAHPILRDGTTVPDFRTRKFSTTDDNQQFFEIHLLQGNSDVATENVSLGKWRIDGLPSDAPMGTPQVEVFFRVEKDGMVIIEAVLDGKNLDVSHSGEGIPKVQLQEEMDALTD